MTLVKWKNRPSIIDNVNDWFNLITDDFYNDHEKVIDNWNPNFKVTQHKGHYLIYAELAGLNKKNVNIEIIDNTLKISGERKSINNENITKNMYSQINYGPFVKSFTLPENVLEVKISAKMENGILQIKVPIAEPVLSESRNIKIN